LATLEPATPDDPDELEELDELDELDPEFMLIVTDPPLAGVDIQIPLLPREYPLTQAMQMPVIRL
jgi:hypothetical protein